MEVILEETKRYIHLKVAVISTKASIRKINAKLSVITDQYTGDDC